MNKNDVSNLLRNSFGLSNGVDLSVERISEIRKATQGVLPYFVAFTARSGSTFLTHEISATEILSTPHEWFNWGNFDENSPKGMAAFEDYIGNLIQKNASKNGVFGCEINWLQYIALKSIVEPEQLFTDRIRLDISKEAECCGASCFKFLSRPH
ncbi:hypothetical protein [Pseudophaeobacter leonis]|uniref:hypothetical protein n=1 Tax=Pseudophaeobacter leonis TaxID=1144477 RepID=UPI00111C148A|nr:hypothetical protein [Pseudophaeobacter leonis]